MEVRFSRSIRDFGGGDLEGRDEDEKVAYVFFDDNALRSIFFCGCCEHRALRDGSFMIIMIMCWILAEIICIDWTFGHGCLSHLREDYDCHYNGNNFWQALEQYKMPFFIGSIFISLDAVFRPKGN